MAIEKLEVLHAGKYLRLVKSGRQEFVERQKISGVVVILALTAGRKIVLVEQYRRALDCRVISLPAGLAGDGDETKEDLLAAAKRELLEETGHAGGDWKYLTTGPSSSGLTSEMITFYHARDVVFEARAKLDAEEGVEPHVIPLADLHDFLAAKERAGCAIDYKIFAALHLEAQNSL